MQNNNFQAEDSQVLPFTQNSFSNVFSGLPFTTQESRLLLEFNSSADADTVSDSKTSKKIKLSDDFPSSQKNISISQAEIIPFTEADFNKLPSSFRSHCQSKMMIVKDLVEKKAKKQSQINRVRQENNGYFDSFFIMPKNTTMQNYFAADSTSGLTFNDILAEISAEYKCKVRSAFADAMESDVNEISNQIQLNFIQLENDITNISAMSPHYKPPINRIMNYLREEFFLLNFDSIIKTAQLLSQDKYANSAPPVVLNMADDNDFVSKLLALETKLDTFLNSKSIPDSPKPLKERGRANSPSANRKKGRSRGRSKDRNRGSSEDNKSRSPSSNRLPAKQNSTTSLDPRAVAPASKPTCFICGKLGHKSPACNHDKALLYCSNCDIKGSHLTRACRKNACGPSSRGRAK